MGDSRSAKVTDEHRAESAALKRLWEKSNHGLSQAAFGAQFNVGSQAAVGFFLNGKSPISLKAARGFAAGLGCDISEFSERLAKEAAKNAAFVSGSASSDGWPFAVDKERFDKLKPEQRTAIENAVTGMIQGYEAMNKVAPSGGGSSHSPEEPLRHAA